VDLRSVSFCGVRPFGLPPGFRPASPRVKIPPTYAHYTFVKGYNRPLPHFDSVNERLFVTFRLHGSQPENRVFPPHRLTNGKAFVAMDRLLDAARSGPVYLRQPEIASIVMQALYDGQNRFGRYRLDAFVIMPNHVHLLVEARVPMAQWLRSLKGFTAHIANRNLGLRGPFWQDESYDHLVRNDDEFDRTRRYIENNPVPAGLCHTPEQYPWSSAAARGGSPAAGRKACPTRALEPGPQVGSDAP
jgi:putative transposase